MINKDGGGGQFLDFVGRHSCYEGDIELIGGSPSHPTRENPATHLFERIWYMRKQNFLV